MHRIDGEDYGPGNTFQALDPQTGTKPTETTAEWLTAVQEEIAAVIEAAGKSLNKADNTQLVDAVYALLGQVSGSRNALLNGDFSVNQRAASGYTITTGVRKYTLDRWEFNPGAANNRTITITQEAHAAGQVAVPGDPTNYIRWGYAAGGTNGSTNPRLAQRIENAWTLNGRKVTVSYWARCTSGTADITPILVQYFGAAGSTAVTLTGTLRTLTTTWTRYQDTFLLPSTAGKTYDTNHYLEMRFETPKTYDAGSYELSDVQLEQGVRATGFDRRPWGEMRRLCERFFETTRYGGSFATAVDCVSSDEDTLEAFGLNTRFRCPKRALPTVEWYSPLTGAAGNIESNAATVPVSATTNTGIEVTGAPTFGAPVSTCRAHWTAEAEIAP